MALGAEAQERLDQQQLHPQEQRLTSRTVELMRPPLRPAQAVGSERPQPLGRAAPEPESSRSDLRRGQHSFEGAGYLRSGADPGSGSRASSRGPGSGLGSPEQRPGATRRVAAMRPSALGTRGSGRRASGDQARGQAGGAGPGALPIGGFQTRTVSHWMGPAAAAVPVSLEGLGTAATAQPVRQHQHHHHQQSAAMATTGVWPAALAATATALVTTASRPALHQAAREQATAGTISSVRTIVLAGAPGREASFLEDRTGWELVPTLEEGDCTPGSGSGGSGSGGCGAGADLVTRSRNPTSSPSRRATLQVGEEAVEVAGPLKGSWSLGRGAADGPSSGDSRGESSAAGGGSSSSSTGNGWRRSHSEEHDGGGSSSNSVVGHGGADAAATGGLEGGQRRLLDEHVGTPGRGRASERHSHGGGSATRDLYGMINRCESWRDLQRLQQLHSSLILPGHIAALMAATAKLLSRRADAATAAAASTAAAAATAGSSAAFRLSVSSGGGKRPSAASPFGNGRQEPGGHPNVTAAAGGVSDVGAREGDDDSHTAGGASLYDSAGALSYMWGLAASALRLARSRELLPRSFATALWAVAKMPLEHLSEAAEAEAEAAGRGPVPSRTQHPHRQAREVAAAAAAARSFPRREEWTVWSVEMLRCGAALLLLRGPYGSSPLDVSLSLWAVARLGVRTLPPGWLQEVVAETQPRLGSFGPQALSNTLWALRRLRYQPQDAWLQAACAAAGTQLPAFSRQDLANFAAALAHFEHVPTPAWRDSFLACCSAQWDLPWRMPEQVQQGPEQVQQGPARTVDVSAVGGGAATARHSPQWLAQTAWAVARLGLRPPAAWVCGMAGAAAAAAPYMNGEDVSQVLWALGELRWREVGDGAAAAATAHHGALPPGGAPEPGHYGPRTQPRLPDYGSVSSEGGCGEVQAEHQHQHQHQHGRYDRHIAAATGGEKLHVLLAAWQRCSEGMEPQQLSACLVGLADLGLQVAPRPGAGLSGGQALGQTLGLGSESVHQHGEGQGQGQGLPPAPAVAAVASRPPREPQAGSQQDPPPQQQPQVLYLPERMVERSLELLARRLPAASAQAVANALWAVVRLGYRPASGWVAAAVGRFMGCLEDDDAGPQEVAVLWWALGRLRWAPPAEDAQELFSRTLSLVATGAFRSSELAMILWAMTRLGLQLPQHMLSGFVKILRRTGREEALATATAAAAASASASGSRSRNDTDEPKDPTACSSSSTASPSTAGTAPAAGLLRPRRGRRPAVVSPEVSPETLVTLLRALGPIRAVSQRSTLAALLERQLRPLAAAAAAETAVVVSEPDRPETAVVAAAPPCAAPAYGDAAAAAVRAADATSLGTAAGAELAGTTPAPAATARQVAVALRAAADVGVSLSWQEKGPYGTAGAALAAAAAALPAANARDLAMMLNALAAMSVSAPLSLMAAALQRAGELCAAGRMAGPGDLPLALSSLGRLVREMVRRRRAQAGVKGAAPAVTPAPGPLGAGRRGGNTGGRGRGKERVEYRGRRSGVDEAGGGPGGHGDEDDEGGVGAEDAAEAAVRAHWAAMLRKPPLVAARAAVLAAALNAVCPPAARRRLAAVDVRQLLLGLSAARLAPPPALLRSLALAVVRHSAELSDDHCTACVRQLASMGADMDPRVARVLVGRMRADLPGGRWRLTWRLAAACTGIETMVAVGVLRRTGALGHPGAVSGGRGGGAAAAVLIAKVGAVDGPAGECELRTQGAKDAVKRAAIRADPGVMRSVYDSLRSLRREAAMASAAAAAAARTAASGAGVRPGRPTAAAGSAAVAAVAARNAGPKVAGGRTVVRNARRKAGPGATTAGVVAERAPTAMVADGDRAGHDAAATVEERAPAQRSPPST